MKNRVLFFTFTCLFCYFCFPSLCAAVSVTGGVTPKFDENDLPQGFPQITYDFDVDIKITGATQDHTIKVVLTSSNFQGIAANAETADFLGGPKAASALENDLYFDAMENSLWTVSEDGTTLTYEYDSVNTSIPKSIKVRCRDWAAHGDIRVTVSGTTIDITERIPTDVNDNNIADGWEKEKKHFFFIADVDEAQARAIADDELGPYKKIVENGEEKAKNINNHPGDGWSRHNEYRGMYTTVENGKPAGFTRLDPQKRM